jgi:hypothetical protein
MPPSVALDTRTTDYASKLRTSRALHLPGLLGKNRPAPHTSVGTVNQLLQPYD